MDLIGNRIKKARENKGYSISDFSRLLNVKESIISSWENNETDPYVSTFPIISKELRLPMQYLLIDNETLSNPTFIPRFLFIYFDFINKKGEAYLTYAFSINPDEKSSTVRFDFVSLDHKQVVIELNEELTNFFIDACDKCQVINWRENEYGASLCNIYNFYNEKPYVNPEGFRYRTLIEAFKEISKNVLTGDELEIANLVNTTDEMYYHKDLDFDTTKLTLETLEKTKEEIERKKNKADELYWDMIG